MPLYQENEGSQKVEVNNGFKLDTAEFVGYAKAKLDTIEEDVKEIKSALSAVRWKVAAIGGTVSLVVTVLCLLLRKLIGL